MRRKGNIDQVGRAKGHFWFYLCNNVSCLRPASGTPSIPKGNLQTGNITIKSNANAGIHFHFFLVHNAAIAVKFQYKKCRALKVIPPLKSVNHLRVKLLR